MWWEYGWFAVCAHAADGCLVSARVLRQQGQTWCVARVTMQWRGKAGGQLPGAVGMGGGRTGSYALTPAQGLERGRDGGKGHDGHTGMIYSRGGMQHQCRSLVLVDTERG